MMRNYFLSYINESVSEWHILDDHFWLDIAPNREVNSYISDHIKSNLAIYLIIWIISNTTIIFIPMGIIIYLDTGIDDIIF